MSCAKYQDRLSDYIDGALSEQERIELERHMRECWSCWVMREDLLYIRQLSRELPDYEPSPSSGIGLRQLSRRRTPLGRRRLL
jgi:anti-sigma factor RsiW